MSLYDQLAQGFQDPMMGMAAGLLSGAAPGGSLGQGMSQGIILSQQMLQNQQRQDMATRMLSQRIEEQRYKRMQAEADAARMERDYQRGVYEFDTQQGQPRSAIGKLESDYRAGNITEDQYRTGIDILSKPLVDMGQQVATAGEARQIAQGEGSLNMLDQIEQLATTNPATLLGPTKAFVSGFESVPGVGELIEATGQRLGPEQARMKSLTTALSNQVIAAVRGAQVGPEEQKKFEQQLPILGQSPDVFMANLNQTRQNLSDLNRRMAEIRNLKNVSPGQQQQAAPMPQRTKPAWATEANRVE